ncbi:hypothetical protein BV898_11829 [Hypsibius exemplaris]|uniref:Tudor domain-containing protein n=1 Tax=Hypsibius exemplaris TaxID=2072580 RepID=A0A1W0WFJ1_HYPEX|nr:hypothetical protein BV898_11829 [Hypsibius exemplaris]
MDEGTEPGSRRRIMGETIVSSVPGLQRGYELKMSDLRLFRTFNPGDTFSTSVSYVMDPETLTLSYLDHDAEIASANLAEEIQKTVKLLPPFKNLPAPQSVICARYSVDQLWYRAGVIGYLNNNSKVNVVFIDYGNDEIISVEDIRPLSDSLAKIPQLSIPAVLASIGAPPGGYTRQHRTDALAILTSTQQALFRVTKVENDNYFGSLFLVHDENGNREDVADIFVAKGIAVLKRTRSLILVELAEKK